MTRFHETTAIRYSGEPVSPQMGAASVASRARIAAAVLLLASSQVIASPSFTGLGGLPGKTISRACAVNSDGSVVVGESAYPDFKSFRWTRQGGMHVLTDLADRTATAVSDDGRVVAGYGRFDSIWKPYQWTGDGPPGIMVSPTIPVSGAMLGISAATGV
ncbi:MAG: hypothetical protein ACREJO_07125 [Phycisphaerales bacterium]